MENRPLFLGRGRGRGRSAQQNRMSENRHGASTWNKKAPGKPAIVEVVHGGGPSEERLKAADKIKESVQKYMADEFDDSSSDEEVNDTEILSTTLKSYENSSSHGKHKKAYSTCFGGGVCWGVGVGGGVRFWRRDLVAT